MSLFSSVVFANSVDMWTLPYQLNLNCTKNGNTITSAPNSVFSVGFDVSSFNFTAGQEFYITISLSGEYPVNVGLSNYMSDNNPFGAQLVQPGSPVTLTFTYNTTFPYVKIRSTSYGEYTYTFNTLTISDSNIPIPTQTYSATFDNGYLSVYDIGSNISYDLDLYTQFNVNSGLWSQDWDPTSQAYWFSNNLPDVTSSYPSSTGTLIDWVRDESKPMSVVGQTKYATSNISGTSTGRYLYILNPALRKVADGQSPSINNYPMTVKGITEGTQVYLYEMTSQATLSGVVTKVSTVDVDGSTQFANAGSTTATGENTDLTDTFVDSDNNSVIQNTGGGNSNQAAETINDFLQNIQNVLDDFTSQVLHLFTAPISHIQQLIQAGTQFFSVFIHIFDWLGPELSGLVYGAFVIFLIIGVLKLLL